MKLRISKFYVVQHTWGYKDRFQELHSGVDLFVYHECISA